MFERLRLSVPKKTAFQTADVLCLIRTVVVPITGEVETLQTHAHVYPVSKVQMWITCFVIYNLLVKIFLNKINLYMLECTCIM